MAIPIPVMLITGPVGVGKSTVASEISDQLTSIGAAHGLIDMDGLRACYPAPATDPFQVELGMKNLSAVWANFQVAGAKRLILVDILESRKALKEYQASVPGAELLVVRLQASVPTLINRVERREVGIGLYWHLRRTAELAAQMDRDRVEDILVDTEDKTPAALAQEVLRQSGWSALPEE